MGYWHEAVPRCHSTFRHEWNGCFFCGSKNLIGTALTSWPTWWGALVIAGWVCSVDVDSLMLRLRVVENWRRKTTRVEDLFFFTTGAPWCWVQIAAIDILRPNKQVSWPNPWGWFLRYLDQEVWHLDRNIKDNLGVISRAVVPLVELIGVDFCSPPCGSTFVRANLKKWPHMTSPWKLVL